MNGTKKLAVEPFVGSGVGDLLLTPDPIPDFGWTHRWEAYEAAGLTAGAPVPVLHDLIGSSHLTVNGAPGQTGSTAPTIRFDAADRPVLRFAASTARLSAAHETPVPSPFTYATVFRMLSIPASGQLAILTTGTSNAHGTLFVDSAGILRINGGSSFGITPALVVGQVYVVVTVVNGASSVIRVNGRPEATGNAGTGSPTATTIGGGGGPAPASPAHMELLSKLIAPVALDLEEREATEAALKASHSIA